MMWHINMGPIGISPSREKPTQMIGTLAILRMPSLHSRLKVWRELFPPVSEKKYQSHCLFQPSSNESS